MTAYPKEPLRSEISLVAVHGRSIKSKGWDVPKQYGDWMGFYLPSHTLRLAEFASSWLQSSRDIPVSVVLSKRIRYVV